MTTLVLTIVGDDRSGLVATVAEIVDNHGGNWENSQLAELAGTFIGVVEVSIAQELADDLRQALTVLDGLLTVTVRTSPDTTPEQTPSREVSLRVIGNDRAGIVRDISSALSAHDVNIEHMSTETRDAAMYGGRLFEATVVARIPASTDLDALQDDLERLAAEIQVDITVEA